MPFTTGNAGAKQDTTQRGSPDYPTGDRARTAIESCSKQTRTRGVRYERILDQYEYLSRAREDPVIALVMRLILEDEERHHGLLKRMATTVRDALNWTNSPSALPHARVAGAPGPNKQLATLLLEMMAMDSDKHARLLEFVERRLEARIRAAQS